MLWPKMVVSYVFALTKRKDLWTCVDAFVFSSEVVIVAQTSTELEFCASTSLFVEVPTSATAQARPFDHWQ